MALNRLLHGTLQTVYDYHRLGVAQDNHQEFILIDHVQCITIRLLIA